MPSKTFVARDVGNGVLGGKIGNSSQAHGTRPSQKFGPTLISIHTVALKVKGVYVQPHPHPRNPPLLLELHLQIAVPSKYINAMYSLKLKWLDIHVHLLNM